MRNFEQQNKINKTRKLHTLLYIFFTIILIASFTLITFSFFTDEKRHVEEMQLGNIDFNLINGQGSVNTNIQLNESFIVGANVLKNDISFNKKNESESFYLRVYMNFNNNSLNSQIETVVGVNYKWKQIGPYFYLVDNNEKPFAIQDAKQYQFILKDKIKMTNYSTNATLNFSAKAIQSDYNKVDSINKLANLLNDNIANYHNLTLNIIGEEFGKVYKQNWCQNGENTLIIIPDVNYNVFVNSTQINSTSYSFNATQDTILNIEFKKK